MGRVIQDQVDNEVRLWMRAAGNYIITGNLRLGEMGIGDRIDEYAVLFAEEEALERFIKYAVRQPEVTHFNGAWDRVKTKPIVSEYQVRYEFLNIAGLDYRIECMYIDNGVSPLHAPLMHPENNVLNQPVSVHLSWKLNLDDYEKTVSYLGEETELNLAQVCSSEYGVFSYWQDPHSMLYFKPRCNLRDAGRAA